MRSPDRDLRWSRSVDPDTLSWEQFFRATDWRGDQISFGSQVCCSVNEWISGLTEQPVTVFTGCSAFPKELQRPSRRGAERRFPNIRHRNEPCKGGHFAAFEQPALFVDEVWSFFRLVR
ncbi:hypothetical protein [Lentzea sp. NPDC059081]|uniref:hypothetical protein n=1 Tax=Lentzea sp. NPDC059081 TaxID=3346719 RepID=UPI0036D0ACF7